MRWRRREGPWGSHHDDASALKWDTSVGSTVELGVGLWCLGTVVDMHRELGVGTRNGDCLVVILPAETCNVPLRIERNALAADCGFIMTIEAGGKLFVLARRGTR
jgi:hypothetical protein